MTTLSISLPEPMRKFVQQQVKAGSFSTTSEYIRSLLRGETQRQRKLEALRADIQVAIDQSDRGECTVHDADSLHELFDGIKAEGRKRLVAQRRKAS